MFMLKHGFIRGKFDSCVYLTNTKQDKAIYLFLYVNDMLVRGS